MRLLRLTVLSAALVLAIVIMCACGSGGAPAEATRFRLYVALFSSIPNAADHQIAALKKRIKYAFEAKNPTGELLIKDLDSANSDTYTVKNDKPTRSGT